MAKTLLLADDSVTIQKVVGITFANEDVELVTVDNGDDALIKARQIKPDLVLADIGMPGLDGYALCAAIRKEPSIAHTPVLLLTGTFETYDDERASQVGANGYISKPFEAQALVDRVFSMLAQSATARSAPPQPAPEPPRVQAAPPAPTPRPAPVVRPASLPPAPATPQSATPVTQARLELPPVPGSISGRPRSATPRPVAPFEFDVTPEPTPAQTTPSEPLWEAEPELEAHDDSPVRRATLEADPPLLDGPEETDPPTDATRLFAPDLLGRSSHIPEIPEPPVAPLAPARPVRGDFSFEDLDFEEPTGSPANQSQIFGESSDEFGAETVLSVAPSPAPAPMAAPAPPSPLADPLYSQTRFLDPGANDDSAPSFGTPNPAIAPPLPDLLGTDERTEPSQMFDELELSDVEPEPELEAEPLDDDAFTLPPRATREPLAPHAATRLMLRDEPMPMLRDEPMMGDDSLSDISMTEEAPDDVTDELELEPELVDAEPIAADSEFAPEPDFETEPELELEPRPLPEPTPRSAPVSWSAPVREPDEPEIVRVAKVVERMPMTAPVIDSALLSQTLEKVAWEAFGSLSEQVVAEVRKRVEAVVWEVVPQLCERLIREEIARLKADLPE